MKTNFRHIVIDLSQRQITTPDGELLTTCQIESNVPIWLWHEEPSVAEEEVGYVYSLGRVLGPDGALHLDIKPFVIIVKRCAENMCVCVIAPNDVEESIYHIVRLEQERVVSKALPRCIIGRVSKGSRHEFDLVIGGPTEALRIETRPSEDCVLGKSKIIWRESEEK